MARIGQVESSLTGRLLVATPSLTDPNFARTVVLLLAHGDQGAFGLVLNRPRDDAHVADHLPVWSEHVAAPAVLFSGGPVEPSAAIGLASIPGETFPADGWTEVIPQVGIVNLEEPPFDITTTLDHVRLFTGYAGWGAGQLENEVKEEAWFVVEPEVSDPFTEAPAELWRTVLRRQHGRLAMFAYYPETPGIN